MSWQVKDAGGTKKFLKSLSSGDHEIDYEEGVKVIIVRNTAKIPLCCDHGENIYTMGPLKWLC